jgi:transposase
MVLTLKEREHIIRWSEEGRTQTQIAHLIGCHQTMVGKWLMQYKKRGHLQNLPRSGRPTPLTKNSLKELKEELTSDVRKANSHFCSLSTAQLSEKITLKTGRKYTTRHVERILHKLNFAHITPRPKHLKNDPQKVAEFRDEFKKNLKRGTWVMKL